MFRAVKMLVVLFATIWIGAAESASPPPLLTTMGVNFYDLMEQYIGTGAAGDTSPARTYIGQTMSYKALQDAHDVGFKFVRVAAAGYNPIAPFMVSWSWFNDLYLWQNSPSLFWSRLDRMMNDLDRAHLQIVPVFLWNMDQFAALSSSKISVMFRPGRGRTLFESYVREFIQRYKDRGTILFYEVGNEINLNVDLDQVTRCKNSDAPQNCSPWDDVHTSALLNFDTQISWLIHNLDPSRMVSSGLATPRPSAMHLMQQPEDTPNLGPDWTTDTHDQFVQMETMLHEPFDIVSAHVYRGDQRFSLDDTEIVAEIASVAAQMGRKSFIGEYGDLTASTFLQNMLKRFATAKIDYASLWDWEFYQSAPYLRAGDINVEPGYNDDIIALLYSAMNPGSTRPSATPRVALTWPLPCSSPSTSPANLMYAVASGFPAVSSVTFQVDGTVVGTVAAPPYQISYTLPANGVHHVSATAVSPAGAAVSEYDVGTGACTMPSR